MVTDQEPRYRLVDSNGNIVGTLFAESDGTLKLQEGTSGNDNELALAADGEVDISSITVSTLAVSGQIFDLGWKHITTIDLSGSGSTQQATIPNSSDQYLINIDARNSSGQNPVQLEFQGAGAGDYALIVRDGATFTSVTRDQADLLNPTSFATYHGLFRISTKRGNRPTVTGVSAGSGTSNLAESLIEASINGGGDITFTVNNSTYDVCDVEVFERSTI